MKVLALRMLFVKSIVVLLRNGLFHKGAKQILYP